MLIHIHHAMATLRGGPVTAKPHSHGPENYLFTAMKSHRHCPSQAQRARAQRALLLGDTLMRD